MPSSSFLSSSKPSRQLLQNSRQRPKYSGARAFYISILLISFLALWGIATLKDIDLSERESHGVFRRADAPHKESRFGDPSDPLKNVDLEASLAV